MSLTPAFEIGLWNAWIFLLIAMVSIILWPILIIPEERFCLEKNGDAYREYMGRTPRYFLLFKEGGDKLC